MTNAIEQTKREMYEALAILKGRIEINYSVKDMQRGADEFESALEEYLEALGNNAVALYNREALSHCRTKTERDDLQTRLAAMTEERDAIQLRLHAVDHAYKTQQGQIATRMPDSGDRGASEKPDGNMAVVISTVRSAQDIMVEYLVPGGIRAKRAMTKLIPLLDNEKLYSALYELEHAEVKS